MVKLRFTLTFPASCTARFTAIPGRQDGSAMPILSYSGNFFCMYSLRASARARTVPLSAILLSEQSITYSRRVFAQSVRIAA